MTVFETQTLIQLSDSHYSTLRFTQRSKACVMVSSLNPISSVAKTVNYFTKGGYYAKNDPEHKKASYWRGIPHYVINLTLQSSATSLIANQLA